MSAYDPYETLIAPARRSAAPGRLVLGLLVTVIAFIALNVGWFAAIRALPDAGTIFGEIASGTTVRGMALLLGSFWCLVAALWVALRLVHRRSMLGLLGPWSAFWGQGWRVFRLCLVLYVLVFLMPMPEEIAPTRAKDFGYWLTLLPISLGLLLLQCGTEELLFRGYLQSQLAARFRSRIVWMGLPSLLFALLHYEPGVYGGAAIWMVVWAGVFGLAAADLTARSGTLGPAIALHMVNNFTAMSLMSLEGYWDGLALYTLPFGPEDTEKLLWAMPLEAGVLLCGWLAARIAVRR